MTRSEKLEALAVAQERVRQAEARVGVVRRLEGNLKEDLILDASGSPSAVFRALLGEPVPLNQLRLNDVQRQVLEEGLLLVRRSALEDVEQAKARLEGMLK